MRMAVTDCPSERLRAGPSVAAQAGMEQEKKGVSGRITGIKYLNADWVEWLMGWPVGLTDTTKPIRSGNLLRWYLEMEMSSATNPWWKNDPADAFPVEIPRLVGKIPGNQRRLEMLGNGQVSVCIAKAWEVLTEMRSDEGT